MTPPSPVEPFLLAGFDPPDASTRAQLTSEALDAHRACVGRGAQWCWFVPGRIEVFGKHTDYAGGRSLVGAVPRGMAVAVSPRADSTVHVFDAQRRQQTMVDPRSGGQPRAGWANYVDVVVRRLAANFPDAVLGADITIRSDLPSASGMSSSSVLVISVATALIRRAALESDEVWRANIASREDEAGYLAAIEAGADFSGLLGRPGVGTHGGSEDHTAILTSRGGQLQAFRFVPVEHGADAAVPDEWTFVIAVSGVAADKTGSARDKFNELAKATRTLVEIWNLQQHQRQTSLARVLDSSQSALVELSALVSQTVPHSEAAAALGRRLDHFVREDSRVPEAVEAFRRVDARWLGELARASQADAGLLLGNQIPETVALARMAVEGGAIASSSFGAGFGGSVWAVARRSEADAFSARWLADYRRAYPAASHAEAFVMRPGPGLVEIRGCA